MTFSAALSLCCLFVVVVTCLAALFSFDFRDNWMQHVGLIAVGTSSSYLIHVIHDAQFVPPEMLILTLGMTSYALGTAYKVRQHSEKRGDDNHAGSSHQT